MNSTKEQRFRQACTSGDQNMLERIKVDTAVLRRPAGFRNTTALHLAAEHGHAHTVRWLLARGLEVDAVDNEGRTPLTRAVMNGHNECAQVLLEHDARVDVVDKYQLSPLHLCVENGHALCVGVLLSAGADANVTDAKCRSPIFYASPNASECVRVLVDGGADIHFSDRYRQAPLASAVCGGNVATARVLLELGADAYARDEFTNSGLMHLAVHRGHAACVELLLAHGMDADAPDTERVWSSMDRINQRHLRTPLRVAVDANQVDCARVLLRHGADPAAVDVNSRYRGVSCQQAIQHGIAEARDACIAARNVNDSTCSNGK